MVTNVRDRIDDLLLARATEGLSPAQALELDSLLATAPDLDTTVYDRAAAYVCLAALAGAGQLPSRLRARLERRAAELVPRAARESDERND